MKTTLRNLVLATACLTAGIAFAGLKSIYAVNINTSSRYAFGDLGGARNSSDSVEEIGCRSYASSIGTVSMSCWAKNPSGTYVSCFSSNAALVATAQSVGTDSWLEFYWDDTGACTALYVNNGSSYAPKQP